MRRESSGSVPARCRLGCVRKISKRRREENFHVPSTVDHMVSGSIEQGAKLIGTDYPYSAGERTLQVDVIVFDKNTGILRAYEVNAASVCMTQASAVQCSGTRWPFKCY